jgi:hypothetical protein
VHDTASREWQKHSNIPNVFLEHYQELFTTGGTHGLEDCLASMENRVATKMKQVLGSAFTEREVDEALKQMQLMKSLGPDGFSTGFFQ